MSPNSHPTLPPELHELIISHVSDRQTLLLCSLASKSWLHTSRLAAFSEALEIHPDRLDDTIVTQLQSILHAPHTTFPIYMRRLTFLQSPPDSTTEPMQVQTHSRLASEFDNEHVYKGCQLARNLNAICDVLVDGHIQLEEINLRGDSMGFPFTSRVLSLIYHSLPTLTHLHVQDIATTYLIPDLIRVLSSSTCLQHLHFTPMNATKHLFAAIEEYDSTLLGPVTLTSLRLSFMSSFFSRMWLQACPITRLDFDLHSVEQIVPLKRHVSRSPTIEGLSIQLHKGVHLSSLKNLLDMRIPARLSSLEITVQLYDEYPSSTESDAHLDLRKMSYLSSLTLDVSINTLNPAKFLMIVRTLETVPSGLHVNLRISFNAASGKEDIVSIDSLIKAYVEIRRPSNLHLVATSPKLDDSAFPRCKEEAGRGDGFSLSVVPKLL